MSLGTGVMGSEHARLVGREISLFARQNRARSQGEVQRIFLPVEIQHYLLPCHPRLPYNDELDRDNQPLDSSFCTQAAVSV